MGNINSLQMLVHLIMDVYNWFVDKAIKQTVIGHLFGDECSLLNASIDTTIRDSEPETDVNPNYGSNQNDLNASTPTNAGVRERMKMFESSESPDEMPVSQQINKQKPTSKAFQMFEDKGIIITQMQGLRSTEETGNHLNDEDELTPDGDEFEKIQSNDQLHNFKRPAGPQNRRSPSRRHRHNSDDDSDVENMEEQDNTEVIPSGVLNHNGAIDVSKSKERRVDSDINHNDAKARIAFLDIRPDNGHHTNDKSPSLNAKPFVPPLDFSTLHENIGGQAPIPAQKAQTGSYLRAANIGGSQINSDDVGFDPEEDENEEPSPPGNKVKRKAGTTLEDEELPPFSQVDQDQYKMHSHGSTDDEITAKMKSQMRKIQGLKKKIRQYEEIFETENGYKPSHAEKAAKPEIKKFMMELSRARKDAKKLKEEAEMGSRSRHGSGASSTGERVEPPDFPPVHPTMAQTLDIILKKLKEKRKEAQRPEDIELMNHEQVQDEKLAVQKSLLHFESIHGRPKTKDEKDLMRPLYDRYRTIKRLLSRQPMSPRGNLELQTVPEDKPIDINARPDELIFEEPMKSNVMSVRVPTAVMENDEDEDPVAPLGLGTMEFAVTRDFSILKTRPITVDDQGPHSPKARRKLELRENIENRNTTDSNLHELSVPELQDELIKSRNSKKKLRKALRDFEENFNRKTGRKVGREDRMPMQTEYNEYKQLKARLKLLEALLSKHHHHTGF